MNKNKNEKKDLVVKVYPIEQTKKVKKYGLIANVQLTFFDSFVLRGITIKKVLKGEKKGKLYISFPSQKSKKDDEYYDIFFPISAKAREKITSLILKEFANVCEDEDEDEDEEEDEDDDVNF